MNSILNNSAALSALQSLNMTQQALATTQNQVSTGLKVASAADNAAYWSIGTQLTSDSGVVSAANDALSQSQAVLGTATSAINSIITTINSIQTALTQATNPGADIGKINTTLASLGQQLTDAVNGASFNGLNLLDGSQTAPLNFVSGFNASENGGSFNYIGFTAQALTGSGTTATTHRRAEHHRRDHDLRVERPCRQHRDGDDAVLRRRQDRQDQRRDRQYVHDFFGFALAA